MSNGVNKVILIGNLGNDPEVRYTGDQRAICNFSLATSESWTDKQTGQKQERTEWHRVVVFGKLAEICGEYLKKGSKAYVEGSMKTRKYEDKNAGVEMAVTEVIASQMQILSPREASAPEPQQRQPARQPINGSQARKPPPPADNFDQFPDDDIPF